MLTFSAVVSFVQFSYSFAVPKLYVVLCFITYSTVDPAVQYERYAHDTFSVVQFMNKVLWKKFQLLKCEPNF